MANEKKCSTCKELKSKKEFYKDFSRKDNLRINCKKCCAIYNSARMKADKHPTIYSITNPIGQIYIGYTKLDFPKRKSAHKSKYKNSNGSLPLLHNSFNLFGFDNHIMNIIIQFNVSKKEAKQKERELITYYQNKGISLNIIK
jgi:predicted GIY-YIG superfamily endonuclease